MSPKPSQNTSSAALLTALETTYGVRGSQVKPKTHDEEVFVARLVEWDARKAELLSTITETNPLEKIRSFLARGKLADAQEEICKAENKQGIFPQEELLIEKARLAGLNCAWAETVRYSSQALSGSPSAISRLALHQIRSLALFELCDFRAAIRDVDAALSLSRLFSNAVTSFYSEILRIRILSRTESLTVAQASLENLWEQSINGRTVDCDRLLTLIRAEIDLHRLRGDNIFTASVATYLLAAAMGDEFYQGLALLDLAFSEYRLDQDHDFPVYLKNYEKFERIKILFKQITSPAPPGCTATAALVRSYLSRTGLSPSPSCSMNELMGKLESISRLLIPKRKLLIGLKPFTVHYLDSSPRVVEMLTAISHEPIQKSVLAKTLWGLKTYSQELHDNPIRALVWRIRKTTGCEVQSRGTSIFAKGVWTVDS